MGKHHLSWQSESRKDYGEYSNDPNGSICRDQVAAGCLQRIANSLEKMANPYMSLLRDRDNYERWNSERAEEIERLGRVIRSLRGVITRMKKK